LKLIINNTHSNLLLNKGNYTHANSIGEAKLREQLVKNYKDLIKKTSRGLNNKRNSVTNGEQFAQTKKIEQLRSTILKRNKRKSSK